MDEGRVCVANIGRAGKTRRAAAGVVVLAATAALWFLPTHGTGWPLPWGLLVAVPIGFGFLCVVQALEGT